MNLNQLEYFLAIVKTGGFSIAADEIYISQSSLSKQIKSLEVELGVQLFRREHSKVKITEAGKEFMLFAEKVKVQHIELTDKIARYQLDRRPIIRLGSIPIVADYGIATLLAAFQTAAHQREIKLNIDLYEEEQQSVLLMLENNRVEFAFLRIDYENLNQYDILDFSTDRLVFVCSKVHPFAKRKKLSLPELVEERFISLDSKSSLYRITIDSFKKIGYTVYPFLTTTRHNVLMEMVSNNLGVALLPDKLVDVHKFQKTCKIDLVDMLTSHVALVKYKEKTLSRIGGKFWEFVAANRINGNEE